MLNRCIMGILTYRGKLKIRQMHLNGDYIKVQNTTIGFAIFTLDADL